MIVRTLNNVYKRICYIVILLPLIILFVGYNTSYSIEPDCVTGINVEVPEYGVVIIRGPLEWGNNAKTYSVNTKYVNNRWIAFFRYIRHGKYNISFGSMSLVMYIPPCKITKINLTQPTTPTPIITPTPTITPTPRVTISPSPRVGKKFGVGVPYGGLEFDLTKEEWELLGKPLVYNWGISINYKARFGNYYTPMMWGCGNVQNVINWPYYSDYVLLFNEPELQSQANCSPYVAARILREIKTRRPDLKLIVGGTSNNYTWMNTFISAYYTQYGEYPNVSGIHVHIYPYDKEYNSYVSKALRWIDGWRYWLNQRPYMGDELWITEIGLLRNDVDYLQTNAIMRKLFVELQQRDYVTRVYWFAYEGRYGRANANWKSTMLVWNGLRTPLWWTFRDCVDGKCLEVER